MARLTHIFRLPALFFFILLGPVTVHAQTLELPKYSVGTFHSPKGFGISGDLFKSDSQHINSFAAFIDMQSILNGESSSPGFRLRYNYNLPILSKDFSNGISPSDISDITSFILSIKKANLDIDNYYLHLLLYLFHQMF